MYANSKMVGTSGTMNNGAKSLLTLKKEWSDKTVKWKTPWTTGGGDFNSPAVATNSNNQVGKWEDFDVTATVKGFVSSPATNFGFIIKFDKYTYGVQYAASENTTTANRPKMVVEFKNPTGINTVNVPRDQAIQFRNRGKDFAVFVPFNGINMVTVSNVSGKVVAHYAVNGSNWHSLPMNLSAGMHVVRIKTMKGTCVKQVMITK